MVVYGEMQPKQHIVIVINEDYEDPGVIPQHFLKKTTSDEKEEVYILQRKKKTTIQPYIIPPTPAIYPSFNEKNTFTTSIDASLRNGTTIPL